MNKKNTILLLTLMALIIAGAIVYFVKQQAESSDELTFSIENTDRIYQIELTDKYGGKVALQKKENIWYVNDKYEASKHQIEQLLMMIKKLQVENPVADNTRASVIQNLGKAATKITFKDEEGDEISTIYVGGTAAGETGTYMIKEYDGVIAANPYIVNIPGHNGTLTYKFTTDPVGWRSTEVFAVPYTDITSVKVEYFEDARPSFQMEVNDELVKINPIHDSLINKHEIDEQKVTTFLAEFEKKHFEYYSDNDTIKNTILAQKPFCKITISDKQNKTEYIEMYRKPCASLELANRNISMNLPAFDVERFYAVTRSRKDFVTAQYYVFGSILMSYNSFFSKDKLEKK
jgi:hypothetical protein